MIASMWHRSAALLPSVFLDHCGSLLPALLNLAEFKLPAVGCCLVQVRLQGREGPSVCY